MGIVVKVKRKLEWDALKRRNVKEQTPDERDVEIRVTKLKWCLGNFFRIVCKEVTPAEKLLLLTCVREIRHQKS